MLLLQSFQNPSTRLRAHEQKRGSEQRNVWPQSAALFQRPPNSKLLHEKADQQSFIRQYKAPWLSLGSISAPARTSAPGNCCRNGLDVIGSHDSSADHSYSKPVVFGHVLQENRPSEPDLTSVYCLTRPASAAKGERVTRFTQIKEAVPSQSLPTAREPQHGSRAAKLGHASVPAGTNENSCVSATTDRASIQAKIILANPAP